MNAQTCQFCRKTINAKSRHCPFCGGEHQKEIVHETPVCPRCSETLVHHDYRETTLDHCTTCEGLWLDTREFKQLTSERDVYKDETIPFEFQKPPLPETEGYLSCPLCDSLMSRQNFRRISGVLIDQCRDHGIWLDAGELDQIRAFIANGGLEDAQDKEILKNKAEIGLVSDKVKNIEYIQKRLNFWDFKYWLYKI